VLIGETAKVDGNLIGESVDVAGIVKGDVTARRISVMKTGRILGDLRLEKLTTEEGGFIQGLVRMEEKVDLASYLPAKLKSEAAPAEAEVEQSAEEQETPKEKVSARAGK
jgi:cytoskeletal protein CcmA (bactofilin family)